MKKIWEKVATIMGVTFLVIVLCASLVMSQGTTIEAQIRLIITRAAYISLIVGLTALIFYLHRRRVSKSTPSASQTQK